MAKRKKRYEPDPEPELGLDISSLIDVSFQLIIYFLVTSTLQPREVDVGLRLPSSQLTEAPPELRPLTLKLNADGTVVAEPQTSNQMLGKANADFDFPGLKSRLLTYQQLASQTRQEPFVVIFADDGANNQMLMNVFNAIYEVGITSVTLSGFTKE